MTPEEMARDDAEALIAEATRHAWGLVAVLEATELAPDEFVTDDDREWIEVGIQVGITAAMQQILGRP